MATKILVIDDERDVREVVLNALEAAGYEVLLAEDGAEGLRMQRGSPADVVITDLFMPDKEGIETIRDLRQEFPAVRIIAMSGGGRLKKPGSPLYTAVELGATTVLHKPFKSGDLLQSVREVLCSK